MYVAVKGGERAIENAHRLLAHERRVELVGDPPGQRRRVLVVGHLVRSAV